MYLRGIRALVILFETIILRLHCRNSFAEERLTLDIGHDLAEKLAPVLQLIKAISRSIVSFMQESLLAW